MFFEGTTLAQCSVLFPPHLTPSPLYALLCRACFLSRLLILCTPAQAFAQAVPSPGMLEKERERDRHRDIENETEKNEINRLIGWREEEEGPIGKEKGCNYTIPKRD